MESVQFSPSPKEGFWHFNKYKPVDRGRDPRKDIIGFRITYFTLGIIYVEALKYDDSNRKTKFKTSCFLYFFKFFLVIFLFENKFCKKYLAYGKYIQGVSIPVTTE